MKTIIILIDKDDKYQIIDEYLKQGFILEEDELSNESIDETFIILTFTQKEDQK